MERLFESKSKKSGVLSLDLIESLFESNQSLDLKESLFEDGSK